MLTNFAIFIKPEKVHRDHIQARFDECAMPPDPPQQRSKQTQSHFPYSFLGSSGSLIILWAWYKEFFEKLFRWPVQYECVENRLDR
ncbi:MAG: hypothetical protein ACJA08_000648 [Cyclobacteriaceae bacterium]|jgi:hypothetical protein